MTSMAALWALADAADPSIGTADLVRVLPSIGISGLLAFGLLALVRRRVVPIEQLREEQAGRERDRADFLARLAAKDALIAQKDKQLADAMNTIVNDTVPALVKATIVMEHQGVELRKRGGET